KELGQKAGEEQLGAYDHRDEGQIEKRLIGNGRFCGNPQHKERIHFYADHLQGKDYPKKKGQGSDGTEKVHGLLAETSDEEHRKQIQEACDQPTDTILGSPVFSGPVLHHLLSDAVIPCPLGDQGDISVHFAVYTDVFDDGARIGLQTTVEVVQPDAGQLSRHIIEQARRYRFRERIAPYFFPPRDELVTIVDDHAVQCRDLVGAILHVGIHRNHDVTGGGPKPRLKGGRLSEISIQANPFKAAVFVADLYDLFPGIIGTAVVHHDHLEREPMLVHDAPDPLR